MSGMKWLWRLLVIFVLLAAFFSAAPSAAMEPPEPVQAEGAVLLEISSGQYLYEQNADRRLYPASTTKIMTALLLLENTGLDKIVTVGEEIELIGKDSSMPACKGRPAQRRRAAWRCCCRLEMTPLYRRRYRQAKGRRLGPAGGSGGSQVRRDDE